MNKRYKDHHPIDILAWYAVFFNTKSHDKDFVRSMILIDLKDKYLYAHYL